MNNPSNSSIAFLQWKAAQRSNYNGRRKSNFTGETYANRGAFPLGHRQNQNSNMAGRSNATGGSVQGVDAVPTNLEIKLTIRNNYSQMLYYPTFNASQLYEVPYDGGVDPVTGVVTPAGQGLIGTYGAPLNVNYINNTVLNNNFVINNIIYLLGDEGQNQLALDWSIYSTMMNSARLITPYRPTPQQNLLQQISTTVQLGNFIQEISSENTVMIPVLPGNTISLFMYVGLKISNNRLLQGKMPLDSYTNPNVLGGF